MKRIFHSLSALLILLLTWFGLLHYKATAQTKQPENQILLETLSGLDSTTEDLVTTYSTIGKLKLKASDKKRLIKIANGSLTDREKKSVEYDQNLLDLLVQLVKPIDQGGGGLEHVRVGDLLRFRHDPRSRETEGADNVSQHLHGKAADIIEINMVQCKKKSLFKTKKLPPFPVKVAWQGGGTSNPYSAIGGDFDSVARANAMRDILGALPGETDTTAIQGLDDLLQQLQRRVIADEAGLDPNSLDYLTNNDVLETLGRVALGAKLGYAPGALTGSSADEIIRSLPQAALERSLGVPPTSLKGDDWNSALERLGRIKVANDIDVDPATILAGQVDKIKDSTYYNYYKRAEEAYRLAKGTLDGIKNNRPEAFRQIGAQIIADQLHYSPEERDTLVGQAQRGSIAQLSLGRRGDLNDFPGNALLILAPGPGSSKKAGELYLGKILSGARSDLTANSLPDSISTAFAHYLPNLKKNASSADITSALSTASQSATLYRSVGAGYMEDVFDLPSNSLALAISQTSNPTLEQFTIIIGQRLLEDYAGQAPGSMKQGVRLTAPAAEIDKNFFLPSGTTSRLLSQPNELKKAIGQKYLETTFTETFLDLYHVSSVGLGSLSIADMYSIVRGQVNDAATRAGASWIEEDLGMAPDSFTTLFGPADAGERLFNAGANVIGGEIFEAFDLDATGITSADLLKQRLGQARIETALGLKPGSFRSSLAAVKEQNGNRFATIFASASDVDVIIGADPGTAQQFLNGRVDPDSLSRTIGGSLINRLGSKNLDEVLGWDSSFRVNGKDLVEAITKNDVGRMRGLIITLGGYNADIVFGYSKGTMQQWATAGSKEAKNQIILNQGGRMYGDRLGVGGSDILASYITGDDRVARRVVDALKNRLQTPDKSATADDLLSTVASEIESTKQDLEANASFVASSSANDIRNTLNDLLNRVQNTGDAATVLDVLRSVKDQVDTLKNNYGIISEAPTTSLPHTLNDLFGNLSRTIDNHISIGGVRLDLPSITIPDSDILSFVQGDMVLANTVLSAASQATQVTIDFKDKYQIMRTMLIGWSSDKTFEDLLSRTSLERYERVLQDYATIKVGDLLDRTFDRITKGTLTPTGGFNPNATPYDGSFLGKIKSGYFTSKEARNDYFYGIMDAAIRKNAGSIPEDFSKNLLEGSMEDRSRMVYSFLKGKLGDGILQGLPGDVLSLAQDWFQDFNTDIGKQLLAKDSFVNWASSVFGRYTDNPISSAAMKIALDYLSGTFNPRVIQENPGLIGDLRLSNIAGFINKQLGLPLGQFGAFYDKYQQVQTAIDSYKAGNLSVAGAIFTADQIFFGGKISEFIGGLDKALGLPGGSTQLLLQFALTQNPVFLVAFVFGFFGGLFGSKIICPNFQKVAQQNVKLLISRTLDQSSNQPEFNSATPSQIITLQESYLDALRDKINQVYHDYQYSDSTGTTQHSDPCPKDSRCGVFARNEYGKQVHIGF